MSSSPETGNTNTDCTPGPSCCPDIVVSLRAIELRLTTMDSRIALIETLHKEISALRESLEFSQEHIQNLTQENKTLKDSVKTLTNQITTLASDNKTIKETLLDVQSRSMRDNLVLTGLPEQSSEDTEKVVKDFMSTQLKLPTSTVNSITFHRVHRIGQKNTTTGNNRPRPIVAKFEHYKQKQHVLQQGKQLKGTNYGLNEQYPKEIMQRRSKLHPVRKEMARLGHKTVLVVDRLYINGQLYRNAETTPWLY